MTGKRPSLAESMRQMAQPDPLPKIPVGPGTELVRPERSPRGFFAATRIGKKKVTAALDPAAHKKLKALAVDREQTTESLLQEAIADLFRKYGKSQDV